MDAVGHHKSAARSSQFQVRDSFSIFIVVSLKFSTFLILINRVLEILVKKGFCPAKNSHLMQLIDALHEFDRLRKKFPHLIPSKDGSLIPPEWLVWAEDNMRRGVDGNVLLLTLKENGYIPENNPIMTNTLTSNKCGRFNHPVRPLLVDFWEAAKYGTILQLQRYMKGGQDIDEEKVMI
jgi:hypothetical protein